MNLLEALLGEHGVFYAQFTHLEQTVPVAKDLSAVKTQTAMLIAALATHARNEEELLFQSLDPHLGEMGPLSVMRMEHEEIETTLDQIMELKELAEAQGKLLHVIRVARDHFAKEEQILFKLALESLGEDVLRDLAGEWADRRGVMI